MNALISNVVLALNSIAPDLNWFFVLEYALSYASFFAFCLALLMFAPIGAALVIVGASLYFVVPGCTYNSNFTFVASISTAAGISCLLGPLSVRRTDPAFLTAGVAFAFVGSLFRIESFLLSLPFALLALCYVAIRNKKQCPSANIATKPICIALAALAALLLASSVYDKIAWEQDGWREWREFNSSRSALSDYPAAPYHELKRDNPNLSLSENDYFLARNWTTADPDVFTAEALSEVAYSNSSNTLDKLTKGLLPYLAFFGNKGPIDPAYLFLLAAAISFLHARRGGKITIVLLMLGCIICCSYFFGAGRLPDRVETPIWQYAALSSSFIALSPTMPKAKLVHAKASKRYPSLSLLTSATTLAGSAVCTIMLCAFLAKALLAFDPSITHDAVHQTSVEPDSPLYEYAMQNDDMINIWSTDASSYAEKEFKYRNLPNREYLLKNPCLGGWSSESPYIKARNREIGMESLLNGLIEQRNTRFICTDEQLASAILVFLREHGHPQAKMEQVNTFLVESVSRGADHQFLVYEYSEE